MTEAQQDLVTSLRSMPMLLHALVREVDAERARIAPPGEWPIVVLVAHLADVDDLMVARMERILADPGAVITDYDPEGAVERGGFAELDLTDALERFEQARARYVALLDALQPRDWFRPVTHETDGTFTVETFTARIVHHDIAHLSQVCRLLG
jgi:hypothetical protein